MNGTPPGPKAPGLLQTLRLWRDPMDTLERTARKYGDCFTMAVWPIGKIVVISHPEAIRAVFTGDPATFHAGEATARLLPFLGVHSVLRADGEAHHRQRHRLLPLFRPSSLAGSREWICDIAERDIATWPVGRSFALMPRMQWIAFQVISRLAIGLDDPARVGELRRRLTRMLSAVAVAATWLQRDRHDRRLPSLLRLIEPRRAAVDEIIREEITRRRHDRGGPADALSLLLQAQAEAPLGDEQVIDELRALLVVGHETTASAMAWMLDLLVLHPVVMERLLTELQSDQESYLDAVIHETLRIRPPVIDAVRLLTASIELGGFAIPRGTIVVVAPYLVHHRRDLYPDPDVFMPERFLGVHPDPFSWVPFGGGARRCLGAALAMWEMRLVVPLVLQHLELRPAAARPERARLLGTMLVPERGAQVAVIGTCPGEHI